MSLVKAKTALALGVQNLARIFFYRLGVKSGLNPVKAIRSELAEGPFFSANYETDEHLAGNTNWLKKHCFFGLESTVSGLPNWHKNCLTGQVAPNDKPWFAISDFDAEIGDIKGVWESSRFDWVISLSQKAHQGDSDALATLNTWLEDWCCSNPFYNGVNWKCGQEASFRVIHLAVAAVILQQANKTQPALLSFIKAHLKRISPTIMYAVAQDNNHATTEAAALFIGGSWLSLNGDVDGRQWQEQGRKWLENRAKRLIENDGSFSQYSVTYHRLMLDTYSVVEVWRSAQNLAKFSSECYKKLAAATIWLYTFTDTDTGDAPNLGSNDGAKLLPLANTDYRDFRPSVQLAAALFCNATAYTKDRDYNLPLRWLKISPPSQYLGDKDSRDFGDGGYCYLNSSDLQVYLRYPSYRFRPCQCDALHVDIWLNEVNLIRDGGTFSYNAGSHYIDYYGGVKSHSTVEFDQHEQMPRLSRFLLGDWLKTNFKKPFTRAQGLQSFAAGYTDRFGCTHRRFLQLGDGMLRITDEVSGFQDKACLRFRLAPMEWKLIGEKLVSGLCTITFSANVEIKRVDLVQGKESRYYYRENDLLVLEIDVHEAGRITTEIHY
ncbi:heparinase II/III-family protein [Pseudoalteromonas sp. DY56-GL79]|uniref:heparinase II/III family protein n=1 Tax=Pseudoalteromonas sp. DY56-GL79 TaxID=2967131 RepID=UPI003529EA41